ncbi:MAG: DNA repair protein RecN [Candidatus Omnitrophota bacterium]
MLQQLSIENFGLIDKLSLEFDRGLNVLTGSTGAGKSIIIDGIRFALGERLKTAQIRENDRPCRVELVFELPPSLLQTEVLKEYTDPQDGLLIIQRQATADGRSRIKVNGQSVTVTQLKAIGSVLVDIHGPHDHQQLLREESHRGILDALTDFGPHREQYRELYRRYASLLARQKELTEMAHSRDREMDMLRHQLNELEAVSLEDSDYEDMQGRMNRLRFSERLAESGGALLAICEDEQAGLSEQLRRACGYASTLNQLDEQTSSMTSSLEQMQEVCEEFSSRLRDYTTDLAFEPGEAVQLNELYDQYEDIKRKYGPALADARGFYADAKKRYEDLVDLEHNDTELKRQLADLRGEMESVAVRLSENRKKTARDLKKTIERELKDLGFDHVIFSADVAPEDFGPEGADQVRFFISPNAGEELKPLADIVSSGEAARLMLALKKALTRVDPIPVLVFDEIDAQIGGRLGTITGQKLRDISADRQILLITHLPQIAGFGNRHFRVTKTVDRKRTTTLAECLQGDVRIEELAHMMQGQQTSDVALEHARQMLSAGQG